MAISHFCHNLFRKSSAALASEIFLIWERVNMVVTSDGSRGYGKPEGKNRKKGQRLRRRQISYFETVLIDWNLTPFSTVFHLYMCFSCFLKPVIHTTVFKLASFPHKLVSLFGGRRMTLVTMVSWVADLGSESTTTRLIILVLSDWVIVVRRIQGKLTTVELVRVLCSKYRWSFAQLIYVLSASWLFL